MKLNYLNKNSIKLIVGILACTLLVFLVITKIENRHYDKKSNQIVQVELKVNLNDSSIRKSIPFTPIVKAMVKEFPEIAASLRVKRIGFPKVSYLEKTYQYGTFAYVDANFFDFFSIPIIKGEKIDPLKHPNSIVLTLKEAQKYFGNTDPIGKELTFTDLGTSYTVTAIVDKIPNNVHFKFDMLASIHQLKNKNTPILKDFNNYLVLKKGKKTKNLESKLNRFINKYQESSKETLFTGNSKKASLEIVIKPLTNIRLESNFTSIHNLTTNKKNKQNIQQVHLIKNDV